MNIDNPSIRGYSPTVLRTNSTIGAGCIGQGSLFGGDERRRGALRVPTVSNTSPGTALNPPPPGSFVHKGAPSITKIHKGACSHEPYGAHSTERIRRHHGRHKRT